MEREIAHDEKGQTLCDGAVHWLRTGKPGQADKPKGKCTCDQNHTPIPWINERVTTIELGNGDGGIVVHEITTPADNAGDFTTVGYVFDEKDAAFMVRAINAHNKLVEALIMTQATIERLNPTFSSTRGTMDVIMNALKISEKK